MWHLTGLWLLAVIINTKSHLPAQAPKTASVSFGSLHGLFPDPCMTLAQVKHGAVARSPGVEEDGRMLTPASYHIGLPAL